MKLQYKSKKKKIGQNRRKQFQVNLLVSTAKKERCKYWHFAIHSRLGKLRIAGWCQLSGSHVK